ncbi:MAG: hypothetical protein WDA15_01940 [Trueperaceae bacterium]|jgi:hypothetical protein
MNNRSEWNSGTSGKARRIIKLLLTVALLFGAPGGPQLVAAQAQNSELAAARQQLNSIYDPLEVMRAELDRKTFDPGALGLELAFEDAEFIVEHVNRVVRFEPYKGVLRGAQGTLAGGGGNAIDQALLTAVLLFDAGYEAEIRGTSLTDDQVAVLLGQLVPGDDASAPLAQAAPELGLDIDLAEVERQLAAEIAVLESDVARMDALLAGVTPSSSDARATLMDAAREYHWVAYRFSGGDEWAEAHPVFGGEVPQEFLGLEATQAFSGQIPEELQHRFRFEVFIERRLGDELVVAPLMEAWERPVANMYGVALTYANVPDGAEAVQDVGDVDALMAATNFFYPMLEGDLPAGGQAFDMLGTLVPPEAANSPFAAVFQSLSGAMSQGIGALGSIGFGSDSEPEPIDDAVSLTAQWFEFTFIAPGEEPVTHRRMVVDRLGSESRAAGTVRLNPEVSEKDAFAALASAHTLMLDPGRYAEAYVQDRSLESVIAMREFVDRALVCALEGTQPPEMTSAQSDLEAPLAPLTLFSAFGDAPADDELLSYRPAPAMVIMSQRIDGTHAQVDVVANPRWSLRVGADGVYFDAAANRRAGVWETRVEELPLAATGEAVVPAFTALEGVGSLEGLRLIGAAEIGAVETLDLPFEARAAIADDLAKGYSVVLPAEHSVQRVADVGWWRVDPVTGETLGRGGDGRGNAFVEYLTTFEVSMAITAGFTVYGVHECTKIADPHVAGCCIVQNIAMAGVGMAVGVGLGIYYGAGKALQLFIGLDVVGNVAGTFLPTVCS